MLSVKKAKDHCGYEQKPVQKICKNCAAFSSDLVLPKWMVEINEVRLAIQGRRERIYDAKTDGQEKNLRCTDHGFAVKKTASCKLWKARKE